jgi:hypothetical protein
VREQFIEMGNAFDDSGNLIKESINEQGYTTRREMTDQGNLLLNTYDLQGRLFNQRQVDITSALTNIQNLQNIQANNRSNARVNSLSPSASQMGFASPYANTAS